MVALGPDDPIVPALRVSPIGEPSLKVQPVVLTGQLHGKEAGCVPLSASHCLTHLPQDSEETVAITEPDILMVCQATAPCLDLLSLFIAVCVL